MKLIRSGRHSSRLIVSSSTIDWSVVSGLQVWSMQHAWSRRMTGPAGVNIRWIETVNGRYAVAILFEDDTWVWVDLALEPDQVITTAHRLSAEHDKPVQRSGQADDLLRGRGY